MHDRPLTIRTVTARDAAAVARLDSRSRYRLLRQGGDVGHGASLLRRLSRGRAAAA